MTRKRKHASTCSSSSPPPLAAMPQVTTKQSSVPLNTFPADFDSDSPMGSPDSSGASSACSPSSGGLKAEKTPMVRSAANARERSRMRVLSKAFSKLKTTLPWVPADTKLSKLDTLRLASCYIAHLREILAEDNATSTAAADKPTPKSGKTAVGAVTSSDKKTCGASAAPIHPLSLTWPFTFNGRVSISDMSSRQKDPLHATTNKRPITGSS